MKNIQELILNHNAITKLPHTITRLQNLQKLDLSQNQLCSFPPCSNMTNLASLELGCNLFQKYPAEIQDLSGLQVLNLFGNTILDLPDVFGLCYPNLKKLYLSYNRLRSLPATFEKLVNLRDLFLAGNQFTMIPPAIFKLEGLKLLGLNNNKITVVPSELQSLTALESLNLNNNRILKICSGIGKCIALQDLDFAHNEITEFPEELSLLTGLVDLDFSGNNISFLPESFEIACANIHQFKISYNNLARIPKFSSYQKFGFEESTADQHVPWVSCTGNQLIRGWYDSKKDPKKLRSKYEKTSKKRDEVTSGSQSADVDLSIDDDDGHERSATPPANVGAVGSENNVLTARQKALPFSVSSGPDKVGDPSKNRGTYLQVIKRPTKTVDQKSPKKALPVIVDPFSYRPRVGWSEIRGRRQDQQDTICVETCFRGNPSRVVLCCFDGHGGVKSSELASRKILPVLCQRMDEVENVEEAVLKEHASNELLFPSIVPTTTNDNQKRLHMCEEQETKKLKKFKRSKKPKEKLSKDEYYWVMNTVYEDLHQKITKNKFPDGTAALVVIIEHDSNRLIVANSGDQRAVLARGSHAVPITTDHKPDEPTEKLRIYHVGGFVNEQKRVDGMLTLSRSLGDNFLQPHVTFRPDVDFVELGPEDRFLIIACDGLWDVLSNEEAVAFVSAVPDPTKAAALLVDYAHSLGSGDNISVIVYNFQGYKETKKTKISESSPDDDTGEKERNSPVFGNLSTSSSTIVPFEETNHPGTPPATTVAQDDARKSSDDGSRKQSTSSGVRRKETKRKPTANKDKHPTVQTDQPQPKETKESKEPPKTPTIDIEKPQITSPKSKHKSDS